MVHKFVNVFRCIAPVLVVVLILDKRAFEDEDRYAENENDLRRECISADGYLASSRPVSQLQKHRLSLDYS